MKEIKKNTTQHKEKETNMPKAAAASKKQFSLVLLKTLSKLIPFQI